jgi:regulator of protease activity HflC (stomatin/prohibitin superfamily)
MKKLSLRAPDEEPATPKLSKWRWFAENYMPSVVIYLMVATLAGFAFYPRIVKTVPSGHVGVLWKRFHNGTVLDARELKDEGLHLILPWDELFLYDLRIKSITESYSAISKDGVNMLASINIRYRLKRDTIPTLHQVIGPDYLKLVGPGIASHMREVISQYSSEDVYSTARNQIKEKIRETTVSRLSEKMMEGEGPTSYSIAMRDAVTIYDTLLYGIELPLAVVAAINRKAEQYYISEEYKFRIEREKRETERKKIEAEGIRDFQQTVSRGISDSYLRWRGIEATLQLSQSTNSKVVLIGGGKNGFPIILGNVDAPAPRQDLGAPLAEGAKDSPKAIVPAPAVPLEKPPAAALSQPPPAAVRGAASSATASTPLISSWLPGLPVLDTLFSWLGRTNPQSAGAASNPPTEKPTVMQPQ